MRIGINCLDLNPEYVGGVNTYLFGLLDAFAKNKEHSFSVFTLKKNSFLFKKYSKCSNIEQVIIKRNKVTILFKRIIKRAALYSNSIILYKYVNDLLFKNEANLIQKNIDILYFPTVALTYFSYHVSTVVSMHDIQQVHFPFFFSKHELFFRRITYNLTANYSNYIQASSDYSKSDFLNYFKNLKESQMVVIPEGVNIEAFSEIKDRELLKKYSVPEKYIFYPAQLWKHKNHLTLLKAILKLKTQGTEIALVLTGGKMSAGNEIFKFIEENGLKNNVHYLGKVPFEVLVALYQHAMIVVVPSLHESSSLPILEAAAARVPIIASDIPSIREMNNRLKLFLFEPYDYEKLSNLILSFWKENPEKKAQIEHNTQNILTYTWQNAAEHYLIFFKKVLSDTKPN